jgi:glycerol dehydrogenase-like iron-containing ADH family enzyme
MSDDAPDRWGAGSEPPQADYRQTLTLLTLLRPVVAKDDTVAVVRAAMRPQVDFLVAVGSGTVNDVTKLASFQAQVPYVVCPTALSMNGYTSAIAEVENDIFLAQKEQEWVFIRDHWQQLWEALDAILLPAAAMREVLQAADAPTTIGELGITAAELRRAFLHARDIRGHYTVLDFAQDLGVLEGLCDDVLAHSGVLA